MPLIAHCHVLALRAEAYLDARHRELTRSERGSVTIEQVIWAVAVIAIVAIVVTAITGYVTAQAGKIK